ncbi:MAG: hypothetical protein UW87_C0003G0021 [Candidatus Moranbacteria bacterium GW2011_GWC2_45_10]|nr:MAG: hypothetical protein UW87_C0003G0021 [Candidatus Moranbacteria bacterium GW2011_GWC2_45_10]
MAPFSLDLTLFTKRIFYGESCISYNELDEGFHLKVSVLSQNITKGGVPCQKRS